MTVAHRWERSTRTGGSLLPDGLPLRLQRGGPFNPPDPATFYGGDERGYTDYPTLG